MREHSKTHLTNGEYQCRQCDKTFTDFSQVRKHMRSIHAPPVFECDVCSKKFARKDKIQLHMLRHTNIREFMCDSCGKQFKRKDKLKEHVKKLHSGGEELKTENENQNVNEQPQQQAQPMPADQTFTFTIGMDGQPAGVQQIIQQAEPAKTTCLRKKNFVPKVEPSDYQRFIYKCHTCLLGFKRRGMLVNHLAKRHPEQKPDSVPELSMPILRTQRDFYCQYCDKVSVWFGFKHFIQVERIYKRIGCGFQCDITLSKHYPLQVFCVVSILSSSSIQQPSDVFRDRDGWRNRLAEYRVSLFTV